MRADLQRRSVAGFTLVELAVVMAIVGLLLGGLLFALSAQTEARAFAETQRRLADARELLLGYAVVNGRLPCPATHTDAGHASSSNGAESIATAAPTGTGGTCTAYYNGYLPALTIGFSPTDSSGYAIDHWGNRIRYAVSAKSPPHFTSNTTMQTNGTATVPDDIDICKHLTAANQSSCGASSSNRVVSSNTTVSVIWSQGKNYAASGAASIDEGNNNDALQAFVSRTPSPAESTEGEFDDQLVWIPVGLLYSRLIAAGRLP